MQHAGPKFPCELHDSKTIMIIIRAIERSICRAMILAMYIFHVNLFINLRLNDYEEMRARSDDRENDSVATQGLASILNPVIQI